MPVVLHVGCGPKDIRALPDYFQNGTWREVRLDIDASVAPDVIGTMTDMSMVETGSMQAVFSSHNIEHLFPHEVPVALSEFRRVLDPSGFALVTCPDLQSVARFVAEDKLTETLYESTRGPITALDIIYGHGASLASGNLFMAHHGGFTMRTLAQAMSEAGFAQVVAKRRRQNLDLWAIGLVSAMSQDGVDDIARSLFPL